MGTSQPLGYFFQSIAVAFASLGVALYYSWKLTLVLSCSIPIAALTVWLISKRAGHATGTESRTLDESAKFSSAAINAVDTVKVFNAQEHEVRQYGASVKRAAVSYLIRVHANSMQAGASRFLIYVMFVAGFWYGLVLFRDGSVTAGNVMTTFYSYLMANQSAEAFLPQWLVMQKAMASARLLGDIIQELGEPRAASDVAAPKWPQTCTGDVEVKDVSCAL